MVSTHLTAPLTHAEAKEYFSASFRVLGILWLLSVIPMAVALARAPGVAPWAVPIIGSVAVGYCIVGWRFLIAPRLVVGDTGLVVRNPFRTYAIDYGAVKEIETGQFLVIHLRDSTSIRVWCLQSANLSMLLRRRSHVDRVADELKPTITSRSRRSDATRVVKTAEDLRLHALLIAGGALVALVFQLIVGT